jgi:hypothetical protein
MNTTAPLTIQQKDATALYGIHVCSLIRARKRGELQALKFGRTVRYRVSELERWIDAHTVDEGS